MLGWGFMLGWRAEPIPKDSFSSPWLAGETSSARTCLWEPLRGEYGGSRALLGSGLMVPLCRGGGLVVSPEEAALLGWDTGQPGLESTHGEMEVGPLIPD